MNRIKASRKLRNMTQEQVAKLMHVGRTTVTMWETSKQKPDSESMVRLSKILRVPLDYLASSGVFENWEEILENKDTVYTEITNYVPADYVDPINEEINLNSVLFKAFFTECDEDLLIKWFSQAVVKVTFDPEYSQPEIEYTDLFEASLKSHRHTGRVWSMNDIANDIGAEAYARNRNNESETPKDVSVRIAVRGSIPAGVPIEAIDDIIDWEEIPADMLRGGKEYFALQVKGNSMYPAFLAGDTVIVQKTPTCNSGDVCVVMVNGYDATLKQVKFSGDGSLTIIPRNPEYPPRTFTPEEIAALPVSIAGVVVELRRKIK